MCAELLNDYRNSKRIVSFGCSLTYGDELDDVSVDACSRLTYAAIIASLGDKDYITYSRSGYGNDSIQREVYHYLQNGYSDGDMLIIGWSGIDRKEYFNSLTDQYISLSPGSINSFMESSMNLGYSQTILSSFSDIVNAYSNTVLYETELHSIGRFHQIYFYVSSALQNKSIPYLMVSAMDSRILNEAIIQDKRFYCQETLMDYAYGMSINENRILKYGHPNSKTHLEWANKIYDWMKNE